jgi:hypothetical protein
MSSNFTVMADQRLERHSTMQVSGSDGRRKQILVPGSAGGTGFPIYSAKPERAF